MKMTPFQAKLQAAYDTLGIDPSMSYEEARAVFRRLAKTYHPDQAGGDPEAAEKFKKIYAAWETISPEKGKLVPVAFKAATRPRTGATGVEVYDAAVGSGVHIRVLGMGPFRSAASPAAVLSLILTELGTTLEEMFMGEDDIEVTLSVSTLPRPVSTSLRMMIDDYTRNVDFLRTAPNEAFDLPEWED